MSEKISSIFDKKSYVWLITGVAGFIGSNIAEKLLQNNQKVIGIDNFSTGSKENIEDLISQLNSKHEKDLFTFIEGDITRLEVCQELCKGIDFVLHQAALGSIPRSIKNPMNTHNANINLNSSVMRSILDKSGVDIKELRNKTNKEIMEILNKAMKGGKAVAPFVPYAGVAYGVGNVLLSGKESFVDIPPEEQTMPTKVVRGAAELFGKDPEAAVMGARVVEEAVSPVPATAFPRKDEEIVPFGEQLERLVPFGGIRGR